MFKIAFAFALRSQLTIVFRIISINRLFVNSKYDDLSPQLSARTFSYVMLPEKEETYQQC